MGSAVNGRLNRVMMEHFRTHLEHHIMAHRETALRAHVPTRNVAGSGACQIGNRRKFAISAARQALEDGIECRR